MGLNMDKLGERLGAAGEGGRAGSHERNRLREHQSREMVLERRVS